MTLRIVLCLALFTALSGFRASKSDLALAQGWSYRLGDGAEDAATRRARIMLGHVLAGTPVEFKYERAGGMSYVWVELSGASADDAEVETIGAFDGALAIASKSRTMDEMQRLHQYDMDRVTQVFHQPENAYIEAAVAQLIAKKSPKCDWCRVTGRVLLVNAGAQFRRGALEVEVLGHVEVAGKEQLPRDAKLPLAKQIAERHAELGRWWAARWVLKKAIEFAPQDTGVYEGLAEAAWRSGDLKTARTALTRLSQLQPEQQKWRAWYQQVKAGKSWKERGR